MPKKLSMFISVILGAFCAVLLMVAGINALNNKTNLPFEISLDMEQEVQVQIDVARINEYNQRTDSVTIFNNTSSGNRLGTEYNPDAVVKIDGKEIALNPWYSVFENLDSTDTLAFTVRSYTANPEEYSESSPSAIKFTIDDVIDQDGNSIYHELTPTNSVAYVKAYDGSNVATGTLNLTNIVAYQDYTKIYIQCSLEIVEYDYTLLSSDTYNIKEFTEAEYTKNALGSMFSNYTNLQYYNDANGVAPLESLGINTYSSVAGVYGYYYYVEMGEYPQTFVGTEFNDALETVFGGYINQNGIGSPGIQPVTDTTTETLYKLQHQQTYYQAIFTGSAYQVAPVSWFTDNNGNTFARSLVCAYSSSSYSSMKYWSTCDDYNLKLEDNGVNVPTTATYNWFKVEPLNWIIYGGITSGSINSAQLATVCSAIENQTKLKTIAQYAYDTSAFNNNVVGDYTASYGGNNWATSYARAVLNGETGTMFVGGSGSDNYANPYVFNSTKASSLTTFLNSNILTTANKTTETASSLIDMFFNSKEQESIALTKNVTYFSQDTFSGLFKEEVNNVPTSTPYYSTTYDKLYLLSGNNVSPFYNSNETNPFTEYNILGNSLRTFPTDYTMGHYGWVYLQAIAQNTNNNYIALNNWFRSGCATVSSSEYALPVSTSGVDIHGVNVTYSSLRPSFTFQF